MLHEQIYDELVRVPVLIKLPGGEHGGSRARGLVGIMDVAPTVLEVTATATPPGVIGTSLLPLIENRSAGRSSLHIYGKPEKLRTLEWSLLRAANGDAELYDLKRDPGEKHDVAAMRPGMVEALSRQLDAIKLSRQALRPNKAAQTPVELTPKVVEQLEALGYLQD